MTRQTRATQATPDALAAIDATVDGRCACGCGRQLDPAGPSGWFADPDCQRRYGQRHATDPYEVYRRPDAAQVLVGRDHVRIPLHEVSASPTQPRTDDPDRWARFERYLTLVDFHQNGPRVQAIRIPTPSPPTHTDPWAVDRLRCEPGWHEADAGPWAWRRRCDSCQTNVMPRWGVRIQSSFTAADTTAPVPSTMDIPEMTQHCPRCYALWPGPRLLAQWRDSERPDMVTLRLAAPGRTWASWAVDRLDVGDALLDLVTFTWRRLERAVMEELTFRDPCAVCAMQVSVDVPRARSRFRFRGTVRFGTGSSTVALTDTDAGLCPAHESELLRMLDERTMQPVYSWPAVPERRGIVTAVPQPAALTPDAVWANLQRLFQQLQGNPWYTQRGGGRQIRCGQTVRDTMAALAGVPAPLRPAMDGLFGIPVVVDESMPPDRWRLVDADGNVLHEGGV